MQRNFAASAFSNFNNSKAIDVKDAVYKKSPAKATTHSVTKIIMPTVTKQTVPQDVVKKKKKRAETGALSVEAVIAKRKKKELRQIEREAALRNPEIPSTTKTSNVPPSTTPTQIQVEKTTKRKESPQKDQDASEIKRKKQKRKEKKVSDPNSVQIQLPTITNTASPAHTHVTPRKKSSHRAERTTALPTPKVVPEVIEFVDSSDDEGLPTLSDPFIPTAAPLVAVASSSQKKGLTQEEKEAKAARKLARAQRREKRKARRDARGSLAETSTTVTTKHKRQSGADDKTRQKRTAWAPGGRTQFEEERELSRSETPFLEVHPSTDEINRRAESRAETRAREVQQQLLNTSLPARASADFTEEPWMTSMRLEHGIQISKLKEKGIAMKMGAFDQDEISRVICEVENFRKAHSLTFFEIQELLIPGVKSRVRTSLRSQILAQISERVSTIQATLQLIADDSEKDTRKNYDSRPSQIGDGIDGKMLKTLKSRLVAMHGKSDWNKIANLIERTPRLCYARYMEYTSKKEYRVSGPWTPDEDTELMAAVEAVSQIGPLSFSTVAAKLNERRGPESCRLRWKKLRVHDIRFRLQYELAMLKIIQAVDPADLEDLDFGRLDPDRTIGYPSQRKQEKFRGLVSRLPTGDQAERAAILAEQISKTETELATLEESLQASNGILERDGAQISIPQAEVESA